VRLADLGLQRRRRALGDDPACCDDAQPIGEPVGLLEVLCREEDGRPLVAQAAHLVPQRQARGRIQAGGRLVEEQHLGLVDERHREVQAPAHAAGVRADAAAGGARQADALDQGGAAPAHGARRDAVQRRLQLDQLGAGHQRVERRLLQRDADPAAHLRRFGCDVVAGDAGVAAGRAQQRHEHPHGRRLAGAVGSEEAVDLARGNLEVDAVDGLQPALEPSLQPDDLDRRDPPILLHVQLLLGPDATTTEAWC
jgi:hypothetical protein